MTLFLWNSLTKEVYLEDYLLVIRNHIKKTIIFKKAFDPVDDYNSDHDDGWTWPNSFE